MNLTHRSRVASYFIYNKFTGLTPDDFTGQGESVVLNGLAYLPMCLVIESHCTLLYYFCPTPDNFTCQGENVLYRVVAGTCNRAGRPWVRGCIKAKQTRF